MTEFSTLATVISDPCWLELQYINRISLFDYNFANTRFVGPEVVCATESYIELICPCTRSWSVLFKTSGDNRCSQICFPLLLLMSLVSAWRSLLHIYNLIGMLWMSSVTSLKVQSIDVMKGYILWKKEKYWKRKLWPVVTDVREWKVKNGVVCFMEVLLVLCIFCRLSGTGCRFVISR
jgi:hypothetical protein